MSGKYIVRLVGIVGGVLDPGGDTMLEMLDDCALAAVSLAALPFRVLSAIAIVSLGLRGSMHPIKQQLRVA